MRETGGIITESDGFEHVSIYAGGIRPKGKNSGI